MNAFRLLEACESILRFEVEDYKKWENGYYLRLEVELIDHSKLFVREYADEREWRYSYHWQDQHQNLLGRWDNAPHHHNLSTFPSHYHSASGLEASSIVSLQEVLKIIVTCLKKMSANN